MPPIGTFLQVVVVNSIFFLAWSKFMSKSSSLVLLFEAQPACVS